MKICECGFANQDEAQVCVACGTSLGAKESADAYQEAAVLLSDLGTAAPFDVSVNLASSSKSEPVGNRLPQVYLILENIAQPTNDPIVIPVFGGILGRAGDFSPEVFSPRVSGIHAAIDFIRGRWFIKHLGRNKSYLLRADGWIELPREQAVELMPGDRLRLADMLFAVSTSPYDPREANVFGGEDAVCTSDAPDGASTCGQAVTGNACNGVSDANCKQSTVNTEQTADQVGEHWVITCPVCGARYEVDSPDVRVSECAICLDALDKRRIASVAPKREVL